MKGPKAICNFIAIAIDTAIDTTVECAGHAGFLSPQAGCDDNSKDRKIAGESPVP